MNVNAAREFTLEIKHCLVFEHNEQHYGGIEVGKCPEEQRGFHYSPRHNGLFGLFGSDRRTISMGFL